MIVGSMTIGVFIDSVGEVFVHPARMEITVRIKPMRITLSPISTACLTHNMRKLTLYMNWQVEIQI